MKKLLLIAVLLLLPMPSWAQDEVNVQGARVYGSPGDMMRWPVTCGIRSVTFTPVGFPTIASCMDGPGRWPDVTPEGWDGPIQHTLGMCLKDPSDNQWDCAGVVQVWYNRWNQDPNYTTAPYDVASNWFYASYIGNGPLTDRNPKPGEQVLMFIVRGNARRGTQFTAVHERSNVALVTWGQNYLVNPGQPQDPQQPQQPGQQPVDMSNIRDLLLLTATKEQSQSIFTNLNDQLTKIDVKLDTVLEHVDRPAWYSSLASNKYVQAGLLSLGTLVTTRMGTNVSTSTQTMSALSAGLALLAIRK